MTYRNRYTGQAGLDSLKDVDLTNALQYQHLEYDGTNWANVTDLTLIDGSKIGIASDTDLMTLTDGVLTVAGITATDTLRLKASGSTIIDFISLSASNRTITSFDGQVSGDAMDFVFYSADRDGSNINQLIVTPQGTWNGASAPSSDFVALHLLSNATENKIYSNWGSGESAIPLWLGNHTDQDMLIIGETNCEFTVPLTGSLTIDNLRLNANTITNITDNPVIFRPNSDGNNSINMVSDGTDLSIVVSGAGDENLTIESGGNGTLTLRNLASGSTGNIAIVSLTDLDVTSNQFNVSSATDTIGIGTAAASTALLTAQDTRTESDSFTFVSGAGTVTGTVADKTYKGLNYLVNLTAAQNVDIADLCAIDSALVVPGPVIDPSGGAAYTIASMCGLRTQLTSSGGKGTEAKTITEASHIKVKTPSYGTQTTVTTEYGLYLPSISKGATSWAIYSLGGDSYHAGDLAFGQTDKAERIGSDADGTLDLYAGTSIDLHNSTADTDMTLNFIGTSNSGRILWMEDEDEFRISSQDASNYLAIEADGTPRFNGTATVWNDIVFPLSTGKLIGANQPDYTVAVAGNVYEYTFAINDYIDVGAQEVPHSYDEGTDFEFHLHLITNGLDATDRDVRYSVEYIIVDIDEVVATGTLTSNDLTIPASTTDRTHLYFDIGTITGTNYKIGATIKFRFTRVALAGAGTAPTNDPFITMVGCHIQEDTVGSRTETAK
jgi:hypothetical protein